jgi:predicted amidohydrolase
MKTSKSFKLGMGQTLVEGGAPKENLERAEKMIARGAAEGCSVVVLPECLDLGWTHPSAHTMSHPIPGPYSDTICRAAKESDVYVAAGLTEKCGDHIYNAAILASPEGEILAKHRKINILGIAQDVYSIGDILSVVETPIATMAIDICADNFSNSLVFGHSLARMGCNLLLSPSAWAVDADYDNEKTPYGGTWTRGYCLLGELYDLTTVGVSNVGWMTGGPWKGRKCIGSSLAVGPGGKILARGPYGEDAEELTIVDVEPTGLPSKGTNIVGLLQKRGYNTDGILSDRGYYSLPK